MGFFDELGELFMSDHDRGYKHGRAEASRREREGTGLFDLGMDIAGGVAGIINPDYADGYKEGFDKQ